MVKRVLAFCLTVLLVLSLSACSSSGGKAVVLQFSELMNDNLQISERMKTLEGKTVAITGFMAAQSPLNGSFIYLVSMPYVSCPYCSPNSNILKSVIPAIASGNVKKIEFTKNPVLVKGTLEIKDVTDEFGYTTPMRILCTQVEEVDLSTMPQNIKDFMMLGSDGTLDAATFPLFDLNNQLYNFYTNGDKSVLTAFDLTKIDDAIQKVKNYGISDFEGLVTILTEFKKTVELYNQNHSKFASKDDAMFNEIGWQVQQAITKFYEWSNDVSNIE